MKIQLLEDRQAAVPLGECPRCGGEIYGEDEEVCVECAEKARRKVRRYDQNTVADMMEEVDWQLQKYLSDDLRNTVYNELAVKFMEEAAS